ncbi:hypothetical protein [Parasegetibacter sp. NRK P23]|uniref:hypothetical protein n=1 Tax=Parasegetibacter sp. NRK P23 TaxID=2942999 RepID=UPI002042CAE9|nr:hypothetical protein [Parasegetibacter sp. NRK P23]MCM5527892.1 hypothetical protein [Parasegetibacter sp. NRK P23]
MKREKILVGSLIALPVIAVSLSVMAQNPVPPNTTLISTSYETHFKKAQYKCTDEVRTISVSGISHQNGGGTQVGAFTISFGGGTQSRTECALGGSNVTCQLINCQGQTMMTLLNTLP